MKNLKTKEVIFMDKHSNIVFGIITDAEVKCKVFASECVGDDDDDDCPTDERSDCIGCIG